MQSADHGRDLAHDVLRAIRQIVRRIGGHSKHLSREVGLTVPQLVCLKAIGEGHARGTPLTVAELGETVQLTSPTVSRIADRLVRAGLVTRTRGQADRRRVCLGLTAAGVARFDALPTPLQEQFIERFGQLDQAEREAILGALKRLTELMGADGLEAAPMLTPESDVREGAADDAAEAP